MRQAQKRLVHAPLKLSLVANNKQQHAGRILSGSPALGSWVNYGLGSENENLPGLVVMLGPSRLMTRPCWRDFASDWQGKESSTKWLAWFEDGIEIMRVVDAVRDLPLQL